MVTLNRRALFGLAAATGGLLALPAMAQTFPDKPIRMIVPFPPGGAVDALARQCAQKLSDILGQQVIIDNRGGSGGMLAADAVARSAPDGYTLFFANSASLAISPNMNSKVPYDPVKSFEPIILVGSAPYILVVNPAVPVKTVGELIALAKAKPGQLNYASAGNGSGIHLTGELFKSMAGVDIVHVPYAGSGPALTDLLSNRVQLTYNPLEVVKPHIESGKLRALAITGATRLANLPDLPTIAESGLPGFEGGGWYAVLAPAGTPQPIVARLNAAVTQMLTDREFRPKLIASGVEPAGGTPQDLATYLASELKKWGEVIRKAGAKVE